MQTAKLELFSSPWPLLGVIHLLPLPGSPFATASLAEIRERAEAEARTILEAGFDGLILENFGDYPFHPDEVEPHTVAAMAVLADQIVALCRRHRPDRPLPVGINVLRNDARAALAIAATCGARFIRVNVHTGAMVTDQGIVQGKAHQTLRYRAQLKADVAVFADVLVKHAHALGPVEPEGVAKDTYKRGGAAALILSGRGTGEPVDQYLVARVRRAVPEAPLFIGSGLTQETLADLVRVTDGAIVGTALKPGGDLAQPVSLELARAFVALRDEAIGSHPQPADRAS